MVGLPANGLNLLSFCNRQDLIGDGLPGRSQGAQESLALDTKDVIFFSTYQGAEGRFPKSGEVKWWKGQKRIGLTVDVWAWSNEELDWLLARE